MLLTTTPGQVAHLHLLRVLRNRAVRCLGSVRSGLLAEQTQSTSNAKGQWLRGALALPRFLFCPVQFCVRAFWRVAGFAPGAIFKAFSRDLKLLHFFSV